MIDEGVNALGWVIFFCVFNMPFGGGTSNRSVKTFASFTNIFCIYKVKKSWLFRLASTPCSAPALKRVFLFSCLTALRKSDIKKLTLEEIQPYGSDGVMYVTTRMQKTKDIVHNPISEEALELIGYSPDKRGKVFPDFKDSMTQAPLKNWLKDAGITKHISYHCSRHSFACLQLDAGTSIAVVQRYLGHKNVATTEVYAKISDAQKRASVGCITLKK